MGKTQAGAPIVLAWAITTGLTGCGGGSGEGGDDDDPDAGPAVEVGLRGAANKGPFLLGSSIAIAALDDEGAPTGEVFTTETTTDLGDFEVDIAYQGLVRLEADGYFFIENDGDLSTAPITLRALAEVDTTADQTVYLNLLTHLSAGRIEQLIADGADHATAASQAEAELREALGVASGAAFDVPALELNLDGDTAGNAYLFAVSAIVWEAAGGSEAGFQEMTNTIARELAETGTIPEATRDALAEEEVALDADAIMDNLAARYADLGVERDIPNLHRVLQSDDDGIANLDDNCPYDANPDQADGDEDGSGDPCDCGDARCARGELPVPPPPSCDPIEQTGCSPGEKCGWISLALDPALGFTACVPAGDVELGDACSTGDLGFYTGYDDCEAGGACQGGVCTEVCDSDPDSCVGDETCVEVSDTFSDLSTTGMCRPTCDPVAESLLAGDGCGTGEGCYLLVDRGEAICMPIGPDAATQEQGDTCEGATAGTCDLNGCDDGYQGLVLTSGGSDDRVCGRFCTPVDTYVGKVGSDVDGADPANCGVARVMQANQGCAFVQSIYDSSSFDGSVIPATVGVCINGNEWGLCSDYDPTAMVSTFMTAYNASGGNEATKVAAGEAALCTFCDTDVSCEHAMNPQCNSGLGCISLATHAVLFPAQMASIVETIEGATTMPLP